ncbi:hypothetical protein F4781DRAFT_443248 [Annulohypoxylon bovei var. microspora]|nr:hypothetical protein F4781DRAFT_443248 [Annulohypoxylon bovei var. microspora]
MFVLGLSGESAEPYWHDHRYIKALRELFDLSYFSRIWIIQELALAKEVHLYHGYDRQSVCLYNTRDRVQQIFKATATEDFMPLWLQHYDKRSSSSRDIGNLIFDGISSDSSLPEDKIFAFFGMICDANIEGLVADYNLAVEQVYTGIAAYLISYGHLSSILERSTCGNSTRVLQKTGSLVLCGHLMHILSKESKQNYCYKDPNLGISITAVFQESFDWVTDIVLVLSPEDYELPSLHLRKAKTHHNIYTYVGLCRVDVKIRSGEVLSTAAGLSSRFAYKLNKDKIRLFSVDRPLLNDFFHIDQHIFTYLWTIYGFLGGNVHLYKRFAPPPSPYPRTSEDPWRYHQELVRGPLGDRNWHGWDIQAQFSWFCEFYDFWMSKENRKVIISIATILRGGMKSIRPNYDDLWNEWHRDYDIARSAARDLIEAGIILTTSDQPTIDLQEKIQQWQRSTLNLIGGLSWSQDFKYPPINVFAALFSHDQVVGDVYMLSGPDDVRKLFSEMNSSIGIGTDTD